MNGQVGAWLRTSPFAIAFFLGNSIRLLLRGPWAAPAAAAFFVGDQREVLLLIFLLVLVLILASAALQYWCFRFKLEGDRIFVRKGVLGKSSLNLPFDRIQAINLERSPIERLFGLVTVSLDSAGTAGAESRLPSVKASVAEWLRERVDSRRVHLARSAVRAEKPVPEVDEPEVQLRLTGRDMAMIGLSSRNLVLLPAVIGGLLQFMEFAEEEAFRSAGEEALRSVAGTLDAAIGGQGAMATTLMVAGIVLGGLLVFFVLVAGAALVKYHDYTLVREGTALRSRAGLLTKREVVVEAAKIQQFTLVQNMIMRPLRRCRLSAVPARGQTEATSGLHQPSADVLEVPMMEREQADELMARSFGDEGSDLTLVPTDGRFIGVSPYYVRARTLPVVGWATLATAVFFAGSRPDGDVATLALATLLIIVLLGTSAAATLLSWLRWRGLAYLYDADGMAIRTGVLGRKVQAFLFRKVQAATVKRSPLQRRKGLATLKVSLASGDLAVPYLDADLAQRLRDYLLYKAESSTVRWH